MADTILQNFYVYVHRRATDGRIFYVGKGRGRRAYRHGRNPHWRNIVAKHGHTVQLVDERLDEATAFELEIAMIQLCGRDTLCNQTDGGDGVSNPSAETRGKLVAAQTPERRARTSALSKGNIYSLGYVHSVETREKMSAAHKGHIVSEETRVKLSAAFKGRVISSETRAKMSAAAKGKQKVPWTEERKAAASAARKGCKQIPWSNESKARLSAAMLGHVVSDETRRIISMVKIANFAKRKLSAAPVMAQGAV